MSEIKYNVVKKDLTMSQGRVYALAIVFTVIIAFLALRGYASIWGQKELVIRIGKGNFSAFLSGSLGLILIFIVLAVTHELLHALAFIVFGKGSWKDIKFGFMWKSLTPYCHCSRAVSPGVYRITLVFPTIILGVIPMLIGFGFEIGYLALMGTIMLIGGIGDLIILYIIRNIPSNAMVLDHPSKIGCLVEMPAE